MHSYLNASYKRGILLIVFINFLLACTFGTGITKGSKPDWVREVKADLSVQVPANEIQGGYYFILTDKQIDVSSCVSYYHFAQKIVNQTGVEECSELEFNYDKAFETITIHEIRIIRNGITINKLDLSKIKTVQKSKAMDERQYDESITGFLFLEDIRVNDLIEYSYSRTNKNPLFASHFSQSVDLQYGVPVSRIFHRIISPLNRPLEIKSFNGGAMPQKSVRNEKNEWLWDLKDIKAFKMDDGTPIGYNPFPLVDVSEYKSWKEVKEWALKIYAPVMQAGTKVRGKATTIMNEYTSNGDRIIAALRFVQDQIRYLGIETGVNTHKPHEPELILRQGFGDCKDKSVVLCCLLKEMGITAHPVLIRSNAYSDMNSYLPSPGIFDHVCVAVEADGRYYYYDPTITYQRGTYNETYFPDYKYGLVITDKSNTLTSIDFRDNKTSTTLKHRFVIQDTTGPIKFEVVTEYTGSDADNFRQGAAQSSIQQIQKNYLNFYASIFPEIEISDSIAITSDDSVRNTIITKEEYIVEDAWKTDEETGQIKLSFFAYNLNSLLYKPKSRKRSMPIGVSHPVNYTEIYDIEMFEPWNIETGSGEIENSAIRFNYFYTKKSDRDIHLKYQVVSKSYECPITETKKYIEDVNKIGTHLGYSIFYSGTQKKTATESYSYFMIFICLLTVCPALYMAFKVYRDVDIETVHSGEEPIAFGGWLILPMIGVMLTPIMLLYGIASSNFFSAHITDLLFNKSAANYNPSLGYIIVVELILNTAGLISAILAAILLFEKRTIFPKVYIATLLIMLAAHLFDWVAANTNSAMADPAITSSTIKSLVRVIIQCLIWIPYMILSYRVKQTFTNLHPSRTKNEGETERGSLTMDNFR